MAGGKAKAGVKKIGTAVSNTAKKAEAALDKRASPNPMTNLIIADVALRGGGRLLRHVVERGLLGVKYPADKAKNIIKGRSMTQTLVTTAVARIATRSVPGALIVGGGLLAKTLYDHGKKRKAAAEGAAQVEDQANKA